MIPFNGKDFRDGYYVVPDGLPPHSDIKAWVVVDVHGAGGLKKPRDNAWMFDLLQPAPLIILVPSFSDGYQSGNGAWAQKLISNVAAVKENFSLQPTLFMHGHSGGAQFAHRFAFHRPDLVNGISAHSAGSWAGEPGFGKINLKARHIPFLISCGEEDTDYSLPEYSLTRIEWYRKFAAELIKKKFVVHANSWPNTGHQVPHSFYQNVFRECFQLATQRRAPNSDTWKGSFEEDAPAG